MPKLLGPHAIVVGAGIGGLVAAKALSAYFGMVTVLERDALPSEPTARTGTPQARQIHVLLRGGLDALIEFFPEFEIELERGWEPFECGSVLNPCSKYPTSTRFHGAILASTTYA
jgi:flavin-dependent dehydrogenase